jgi:ABC-type sugar transport system ATPase subunit
MADGSRIDVVSRPEHLTVQLDGQGIPGTIVQINNFGSSLECLIDLRIDGSQPIVLHPDRANGYQVGQEVRLAIDPDKVRVFPR